MKSGGQAENDKYSLAANFQGMTCDVLQQVASCDVRQQVAMCGCESTFLKLAMCVCAVHFQTCEVRSQLCTFLSNNARYKDSVPQKLRIFTIKAIFDPKN